MTERIHEQSSEHIRLPYPYLRTRLYILCKSSTISCQSIFTHLYIEQCTHRPLDIHHSKKDATSILQINQD